MGNKRILESEEERKMKIKIIDLLSKIVKGEEMPKKIKYKGVDYEYNDYNYKYVNRDDIDILSIYKLNILTEEVEIIEEDKKIEKLLLGMNSKRKGDMTADYDNYMLDDIVEHNFDVIHKKLNELIDTINELKKDD